MKKITIGILAHVDAGKTTLSEALLYKSGTIRKFGRVDHKDAFLDNNNIERERGITVFSKQAQISLPDINITLLDTPGHVDFSAETERVLSVVDYTILVINASEGVQGHTDTIWNLLESYNVPVFIFVNKTDTPDFNKENILFELKNKISNNCVDFTNTGSEEFKENIAFSDEKLLEKYSESLKITKDDIKESIFKRKIIPCYFGSALKLKGIDEFLEGIEKYTIEKKYPVDNGARVFKIKRDDQGNRLTFLKVTGGALNVKQSLNFTSGTEKINQIRIYSGSSYKAIEVAEAGTVCAVTGPISTYAGEGAGFEKDTYKFILQPVLNYKMILPDDTNIYDMFDKMKTLEEEEPSLHIVFGNKDIHVRLMGEIQTEILKTLILERFNINVEFSDGNILYKETISDISEGVGHYEPLRHYAEVHLLIEPCKCDGITFESKCSEDILDKNWQRLIRTHIFEKEHRGVLTGSPITGIKVTLVSGKAHIKHTEGGDFRQATYRAIRNGLAKNKSVLLEPYYNFKIEVPKENIGRLMSDIQTRYGSFSQPQTINDTAVISGEIPASTMQGYITEFNSYTKGKGKISLNVCGYKPCHNSEEIIENTKYDFDSDLENSADSIFCSHGNAFLVKWYDVENYMHIANYIKPEKNNRESDDYFDYFQHKATEKELEEIFNREFGKNRNKSKIYERKEHGKISSLDGYVYNEKKALKECILVDGYNVIHAWKELHDISVSNFGAARDRLLEILSNYQAYRKCLLIVVFDAYKVKGGKGSKSKYDNIYVVFTKEAETADMYIEKTTHEISKNYRVRVATSDGLEQIIILGRGAARISAREFEKEVNMVTQEIRDECFKNSSHGKEYLMDKMK
ncbi:MAG: TetM/TetW/TetO/TetS family tetracycline resistance ribosomal protection protein [Oscillospiraceae bacterium]|nr:TetM/TetW/TetO/TetS family tetracycline resistance ribosomal protection protein [Oscillospiraceae bacterium]